MTSAREEPGRWVLLDLDHHEEQQEESLEGS